MQETYCNTCYAISWRINKNLTGTRNRYCCEITYTNNAATVFKLQGKPSPSKSLAFQTAWEYLLPRETSLLAWYQPIWYTGSSTQPGSRDGPQPASPSTTRHLPAFTLNARDNSLNGYRPLFQYNFLTTQLEYVSYITMNKLLQFIYICMFV